MKRFKRHCFGGFMFALVLAFLAAAGLGHADSAPGAAAFDPAASDAFVAGQVKTGELVGLSLAVVRDGRMVLSKGYGVCSLESRQPVTTGTLFAIGSVSKQFTAACILLLAEDGKLSVHDKVAKYYPHLTKAGEITLLDLMNHVSGYPDYYPLDFVDRRMQRATTVDEVIRQYASGKLDFEPGTRWSYSNTGFLILGRVVEKVSGKPFGEFLEERILKPLGMTHTVYEPEAGRAGLARGYTTFLLGEPEPLEPEAAGWLAAAGGMYSTASDLARWDLALIGGKVLKPESYKVMTTARLLDSGRSAGYGGGLSIRQENGETIISHNGAVSGFLAQNTMLPATRSAIVLLSNYENRAAMNAIQANLLPALFRKDEAAAPKIAGPPALETALAFLHSLEAGAVDRAALSEEFSVYLTDAKIQGAAERLNAYGEPVSGEVESLRERGGMEVATILVKFKAGGLKVLMYRSPNGKIQEYFLYKE